jgi:hypothetical protein
MPVTIEPLANRNSLRWFVSNVVLLIVLGVAISGWLICYTDVFPLLGGFLGLTGAFAWIAFLSNIVSEERKKELQKLLEARVFLNPRTTIFVLILLILFLGWWATHGSITLSLVGDSVTRNVTIKPIGEGTATDDTVTPGAPTKRPFFVLGQRELVVKPTALPALRITLRGFGLRTLIIPDAFVMRPVLLVRPPTELVSSALRSQMSLRASLRRRNATALANLGTVPAGVYNGETVWIGCDVAVAVPAYAEQRWHAEKIPDLTILRWLSPSSIAPDTILEDGDVVRVELLNAQGDISAFAEVRVRAPVNSREFPQEVKLQLNA